MVKQVFGKKKKKPAQQQAASAPSGPTLYYIEFSAMSGQIKVGEGLVTFKELLERVESSLP